MNLAALSDDEKAALAVGSSEGGGHVMDAAAIAQLPLAERYIVSRCHELCMHVTESLEAYVLCSIVVPPFLVSYVSVSLLSTVAFLPSLFDTK